MALIEANISMSVDGYVTGPGVDQRPGLGDGGEEEGLFRMPVFVVTHQAQKRVSKGETTFTFVTEGVEVALAQAAEAAGDKLVHVMGGASTIQQALRAGLVDQLRLHVAPILLGAGTPLFDHL